MARAGYAYRVNDKQPSKGHDERHPEGQVSSGPSSFAPVEASGGADAVPETPDNVPADHSLDVDHDDAATTS